jgi:hypothetical protein
MSFIIHTIDMPDTAGPQTPDRLTLASFLGIPFPAGGAGVTSVGTVTAGSGYTFTPTLAVTGGTLTAASAAGVAPVVLAGTAALLHATMKVVSATVGAAGSGYVTNDTVLFSNGVELTATASAGAVTAWAVTTAGSITDPGPLPSVLVQISTSGSGVGATAVPSWGLNTVVVDDSGSYSSASGTAVTVTSVDGNGTSGAVASTVTLGSAGTPLFKKLSPVGMATVGNYGVHAMASGLNVASLSAKYTGFAVVKIYPVQESTGTVPTVTAGTLDALVWS